MNNEELSPFAQNILATKYLHPGETRWEDVADRVVETVMGPHLPDLVERAKIMVRRREFIPGGRYLANVGRPVAQYNNCFLLDVEDNRQSIAELYQKVTNVLMSGGGVGVVWSKLRPRGAKVSGAGGESTGPCAFMQSVNEIGRGIVQGGGRRAAIWAGLHWNHPDVFEYMRMKDWNEHVRAGKDEDFSAYAPMDMTNITIILDDDFFSAYEDSAHPQHAWAHRVYAEAVEQMLKTGEPGFSVDIGENAGENLRNPCGEITSRDDSDVCNLGSINLARVETVERMAEVVELATAFLLCGTLASSLPYEKVHEVREKNRRLGLGLMGMYEWLVTRKKPYAPDAELGKWLEVYTRSTGWANLYADQLGVSRPIKTRAIAPTGTLAIIGETTSALEPLYAVAYKRRYHKDFAWKYQYVIDGTAQRLIDQGVNPHTLETAYDLAHDPGRRLSFQVWVQQYVDHAISSTLNLPAYDKQPFTAAEFGDILMEHLPQLRGVTTYPDGSRAGQPLTVVPYGEAVGQEGVEFEEVGNTEACRDGVCGI